MTRPPNLPIGKSSFESIRSRNDLYVDKTRHIFRLIDQGEYYFLSRPRRFGKSLMISTLKCLFQGKKELFDGLWITEHGDWDWHPHPVVVIDFNELDHKTPENMRQSLSYNLFNIARESGISINDSLLPGQFVELIVGLSEQTQRPVVVLVDEYDKPIISHLGRGPEALGIAKENREIMKSFFGVLKGTNVSQRLRFVFFTGVSRFSRVSIFSELNNLEDITMTEEEADMLGYTQEELERDFSAYIPGMAQKLGVSKDDLIRQLAEEYNGYRFSRKAVRVYNPFSVMCALKQKAFENYWFETGTPTFLINLLNETGFPLPMIEDLRIDRTSFSTYDLENLKPEAILFQTGYITIKEIDTESDIYHFDYPNREVKKSFLKHLLASYVEPKDAYTQVLYLSKYLRNEKLDEFFEAMTAIFSAIAHTQNIRRDEAWFHTIFYLMVSASGVRARSEVLHYRGRIDLVMEFSDKVYVIEFKCNRSAKAALKQIHEKGYADMFRGGGKKIVLMGINFDSEKRNLAEWEYEAVEEGLV